MSFEHPNKGDVLCSKSCEYVVTSTNTLGRGGNGHVIPVSHAGKEYAAKIYKRPLEEVRLKRFLVEREVLDKLSHTSIVPIIDKGTLNDRPFFVMPRAKYSLFDLIPAIMEMPDNYVRLVRYITSALVEFHSHRIGNDACWHRDIKPGNILWFEEIVDAAGGVTCLVPKLTDFGIAHLYPEYVDISIETADQPMSRHCFAPEQLTGGGDPRSDIFSWGFVLWWASTGYWPRGSGPKPSQCMSFVLTFHFDSILEKALQNEPDDRYQSMHQLKKAFDFYFDKLELTQKQWNTGNIHLDDGIITTVEEIVESGYRPTVGLYGSAKIVDSRGLFTGRDGRPANSKEVSGTIRRLRDSKVREMLGL